MDQLECGCVIQIYTNTVWGQMQGYMERFCINTDNPLYTDTWYNDKIRYNDNLTVTKRLA